MTRANRGNEIAALLAKLVELTAEQQPTEIPAPRQAERVLLTVAEAAERLSIGKTTAYALVMSGEIESVQIGRLRRIHINAVDSYAQKLNLQQNDEI